MTKLIKLTTGEEVIAEITENLDNTITLKNAVTVGMVDRGQLGFGNFQSLFGVLRGADTGIDDNLRDFRNLVDVLVAVLFAHRTKDAGLVFGQEFGFLHHGFTQAAFLAFLSVVAFSKTFTLEIWIGPSRSMIAPFG